MNIPKQFYVGLISRPNANDSEIIGYMTEADKQHTKDFEKRKSSVDKWRRSGHGSWQKDNGFKFIENKPQIGFKLVTNVRRYMTSNVVWRVEHPEGFEFEISSENLCDLLSTNTLIKGEFQEELFFTKKKQLISVKTQFYKEELEKEKITNVIKEKTKEISYGDIIQCKSTGCQYIYYGRPHIYGILFKSPNWIIPTLPPQSKKLHILRNIENSVFNFEKNLNFDFEIISSEIKGVEILTPEELSTTVIKLHPKIVHISENLIKKDKLKYNFQEVSEEGLENQYNTIPIYALQKDSQYYILSGVFLYSKETNWLCNKRPYFVTISNFIRNYKFYKDEKIVNFECFLFKDNSFELSNDQSLITIPPSDNIKLYKVNFSF